MAGALLIGQGDPAAVVSVPGTSHQPDLAIGWTFERFDGIDQPPLDHPATETPLGFDYGGAASTPRPGQLNQPAGQVYTPGPLSGVVGVIGGQPLPAFPFLDNSRHGSTRVATPTVQFRLGVGQYGPSSLAAAQTTALGGITNNPPQPGDLSSIIAGIG